MREEIIAKIDRELLAEKLLFDDKENYTIGEQQLMAEVIEKRLNEDSLYYYFGFGYFNKLVNAYKNDSLSPKNNALVLISSIAEGKASQDYEAKLDRFDYVSFICNERYGTSTRNDFNYPKMIKNNIWTASKIEGINRAYFDFLQNDMDFIVTNNLFFERYPEFFDDNYIENLEVVTYKRKILLPKEEKQELKKALKILSKNINKYKEKRGLNVKKKTLFQKIVKK